FPAASQAVSADPHHSRTVCHQPCRFELQCGSNDLPQHAKRVLHGECPSPFCMGLPSCCSPSEGMMHDGDYFGRHSFASEILRPRNGASSTTSDPDPRTRPAYLPATSRYASIVRIFGSMIQ